MSIHDTHWCKPDEEVNHYGMIWTACGKRVSQKMMSYSYPTCTTCKLKMEEYEKKREELYP